MIKPLLLGNKNFPVNLIQAPLAGYTSAPFRLLTWKYGQPAFSCTEMISCKALLHKSRITYQHYIAKDPQEGPVCFQLFGSEPQDLAEATKIVTDYGADLIDLNCGCPVRKVRSQGAGSTLLDDPKKLQQMIAAMKQNTHLPVSIKIRVEGGTKNNANEKFNTELAKVINESAVDFVVVHGRHWTEHYQVPCHYEEIQFFVEQLKIPVIGNGDVTDVISLKKMLATGCAGVMIGRAGVGQPWLFRKLVAQMRGEKFSELSMSDIGLIFIEHVERLEKLLGNEKFAVLHARKLANCYARGLVNKNEFCQAMNGCKSLCQFKDLCERYFKAQET